MFYFLDIHGSKIEIDMQNIEKQIVNVVTCQANNFHGLKSWIDLLEDENLRIQIINDGSKIAEDFLLSL